MNDKIIIALIGIGSVFIIGLITSKEKQKEPSLQQWVNRLIEHVDHIYINEAVKRFAYLVENGLEPAHAFELVVRT